MDWTLVWCSIGMLTAVGVGASWLILLCRSFFSPKGSCTLTINDAPERTQVVAAGQTLLQALTSNGIQVPSPCGGRATCKQCRVRIVRGAESPLDTEAATFSRKQLQEGWRLSCQQKIRRDMAVRIEARYFNVQEWEATVVSNQNVATFIKELIVQLPEGQRVDYQPGGYLQLRIPPFTTHTQDWKASMDPKFFHDWEEHRLFGRVLDFSQYREEHRAYSVGSYPDEAGRILFVIRIATPPAEQLGPAAGVPWGFGSSYLFSLKPGDSIRFSGPYGESFMREGTQDLFFLVGGAGASFGRSHILDLLRAKHSQRNISLWYGARSLKESIYQDLYEGLAGEFSNFSYHLVLSEPTADDLTSGWPANDPERTGFLYKAFEHGQLKRMKEPEQALYYVCGPPMHNKSVLKLLDEYGVSRDNVVLDDFGS